MNENSTLDGILNHRVQLEQPATGYRVAIDTILLAAATPVLAGDRILDMGCGVGGAMLSVACRVIGLAGLGVEIQTDLLDFCRRNIARNNFASGLDVRAGDITTLLNEEKGAFDHVLANPPYHDEARHDVSDDKVKRLANSEKPGDIALWISSAALALKPAGTFTLIHRADRRDEILSLLQNAFGEIEILSLLPKEGAKAKRVIFRARKGAVLSLRESRPLVLHKGDGAYTDEAEAILRHCQALPFQSP